MKFLMLAVIPFLLLVLACGDDNSVGDDGELVFYASPIGLGQYDQMSYADHRSEVNFKPSDDVWLVGITPNVVSCNGQCYFEAAIIDSGDDTVSVARSQSEDSDLYAQFLPSLKLNAGQWYRLYLRSSSTMAIEIHTSGVPTDGRQADFEVIYATTSTTDLYDRGSTAFALTGLSR